VWVGTTQGDVFTYYDAVSYYLINRLKFHTGDVLSISVAPGRFVFTAAGKSDGRIAVWRWPRSQLTTAAKQ